MTTVESWKEQARATPRDVPFIGREAEMRELEQALARALLTHRPQTVTLVGGSGIGKSRLLEEFLAEVRAHEPQVRVYRGNNREHGPPLGAIQRILRARFDLPAEGTGTSVPEAFRATVEETFGDDRVTEFVHFLGAFLDLRLPDSPLVRAVEEDPEHFAHLSRIVLRRFFEVDAARGPLILTFEDLHRAHDDSLSVVQYLVRAFRDAPILCIVVARPELLARRVDWMEGACDHMKLELSPLDPDRAAELMRELLAPTGEPPAELIDTAVDMSGGSPYLLEQMVRAFHECGALVEQTRGSKTWEVCLERLERAELPLTVDDAISARIAALMPAERELLERASSMGSVFWLGALVAISRADSVTPELWGGHETLVAHHRDLLARLAERDYVLQLPDSSIPGEAEYAFKHNLERETLHGLTSQAELRRFHRVVAEWLEFRLGDGAEAHCELLAQHYELGGALRRAGYYYILAGDRARARYAAAKAMDHYGRGLALLGDEDIVLRIDALHGYGDVLHLAGRKEDALAVFRTMLELAFRLDLKAKGGVAHNRIGRLFRSLGDVEQAMRHLGTGHALFDAVSDMRGVASSLDDIGKVHWMRRDYSSAERFLERARELRIEIGDARSIAVSYNNLGLVYEDSGRSDKALEAFERALELRREIGDKPGIAQTLNSLGSLHQGREEHEHAVELFVEALEMARDVGDRARLALILTNLGESYHRLNRPAHAIDVLMQAVDISEALGDRLLEGEILRGLAKASLSIRDFPKAREYITRSIALLESTRSRSQLAVALRTKGEILASGVVDHHTYEVAYRAFERSIEIFKALGEETQLARSYKVLADFVSSYPSMALGHSDELSEDTLGEQRTLRDRVGALGDRLAREAAQSGFAFDIERTEPDVPKWAFSP